MKLYMYELKEMFQLYDITIEKIVIEVTGKFPQIAGEKEASTRV